MERLLVRLQDRYKKLKIYGQKNGDSVIEKERRSTGEKNSSMTYIGKSSNDHFYDLWEVRRNNALFKEMCIECGLPAPKWYYMKENIDPAILKDVHYPVVVKPVEMCEDTYVFICHTEEELLDGYNQALGRSASRQIVVEEYVAGVIFDATVYVKNGKVSNAYPHMEEHMDALQMMVDSLKISEGKFVLNGIRNEGGCFFIGFELREWRRFSA